MILGEGSIFVLKPAVVCHLSTIIFRASGKLGSLTDLIVTIEIYEM